LIEKGKLNFLTGGGEQDDIDWGMWMFTFLGETGKSVANMKGECGVHSPSVSSGFCCYYYDSIISPFFYPQTYIIIIIIPNIIMRNFHTVVFADFLLSTTFCTSPAHSSLVIKVRTCATT